MLLSTVVALSAVCYLHVCSPFVVYTWLGVRAGRETDDRKYNVRTVDAKVLDPNGPNIFVQNGGAAHSSNKRQIVDYRYEARPEKSTSHSSRWMCHARAVLPAGGAAGC